jgi:hypothetical protein
MNLKRWQGQRIKALESGTFIHYQQQKNKSEAKAEEERANSLQSEIATHNVIQKYKSTRD